MRTQSGYLDGSKLSIWVTLQLTTAPTIIWTISMLPSTNKNTGLLANCILGNLYSLSLKQKGVEVTENVFFFKK